jgi:threonine aldolase
MNTIDLRSDTVTWPTPAMRQAMADAPVGDDVMGEDPTVNQLEAEAAALFGKEAGLFVTSGTQGNLISVLTHCQRGHEFIVGKEAHIFRYEAGGSAALGGAIPNTLPVQPDGTLKLEDIRANIHTENPHYPRTRLICLENTQGTVGGIPVPTSYIDSVGLIAREHNLKLHIDGARIFNAATALNTEVKTLTAAADSVTFCLSKGLCAPVGSVLVGSKDFIYEARRIRKQLGGGMRQAGILAAAGLIALREMRHRLHEDHLHARLLAEGLVQIPHLHLDLSRVQSNMIFFELQDTAPVKGSVLSQRLRQEHNIHLAPYAGENRFRAVTHYWIQREHIDTVLNAFRSILG